MKSDLLYIHHIFDCINQIKAYTVDLTEEDFQANQLIRDAVVRNFEVIGEATKKVSPETRASYPDIEWRKMAGMRDKLIHDYFEVDYMVLWTTVQDILPDLGLKIGNIIKDYKT